MCIRDRIWCAPGNGGIASEPRAQCVNLAADDLPGLRGFAAENRVDLTVVGPDNPLALGVVDFFEKDGLRIWGPSRKAAQFESSKAFSQAFMEKYGIPTARSQTFSDAAAAKEYVPQLKPIFAAQKIPPELVWVAEVESSFDRRAESPAGAAGLFQLMPDLSLIHI